MLTPSDLDEDVKSAGDFDSESLFAVSRFLLEKMSPEQVRDFPDSLPRSMAAKVSTCTKMADLIKVPQASLTLESRLPGGSKLPSTYVSQ